MNNETKIMDLYNDGFCDSDIANKLGLSYKTISHWRKKNNLPTVWSNRKRLSSWEKERINKFIDSAKRGFSDKTKEKYRKGLSQFVMSLNKPLASINHIDVENYIRQFNDVDETRINELLRTCYVRNFKIPFIPVSALYRFANQIIAVHVFARDKAKCQVCGKMGSISLHHIKGKYDLRKENMVTLCPRCHITIRHASLNWLYNEKELNIIKGYKA